MSCPNGRPLNRHWGCSKAFMLYWLARVSMNIIAAAARGIGPAFPVLIGLVMVWGIIELLALHFIRN